MEEWRENILRATAEEQTMAAIPAVGSDDTQLAWSIPNDVVDYPETGAVTSWPANSSAPLLFACGVVALIIALVGVAITHAIQQPRTVATRNEVAPPVVTVPPSTVTMAPTTVTIAPPSYVSPPKAPAVFAGDYTETETQDDNGHVYTAKWHVTPCATDGCVHIRQGDGAHFQMDLTDGQWTYSGPANAVCEDGSKVAHAGKSIFRIDAATLRGTEQIDWLSTACGIEPDKSVTTVVLTKDSL